MTVHKSSTVLLSTIDGDIGLMPAAAASATAIEEASSRRKTVTLRDPVTDKVLATIKPRSEKRVARKKRLTELGVRKLKSASTAFVVWDTLQRGLTIRIQPTGSRSWKVVYSRHGRPRWLHLGNADAIGLADARTLAAEAMLQVARGKDPAAEKRAERSSGSFAELADRYLTQHAQRHNKSWKQAAGLIRLRVLPRWGKLQASTITRSDVKQLMASIAAPVLQNQVLASVSAIFTWAVREELLPANPAKLISRNRTKSRERVLFDSEIPKFWAAFDNAGLIPSSALKTILLTGQRPGEVSRMRLEHIADGWWQLPGEPVPALGWPGTKNAASHRIWLAEPVRAIIAELSDGATTGFVFAGPRGRPVKGLDQNMRDVCGKLGVNDKATPHDLRRTHGSTIRALGFGRDAMNRIQNHREGGVTDTYDRHGYADENKRVMETVAARIVALAEGRTDDDKVVQFTR